MKLDGSKLRRARLVKGMTQGEVGKATKLSIFTVLRAEDGRSVHPSTGKKLCDFLGVSLDDALEDDSAA